MRPLIRSAVLSSYVEVASSLGLDPFALVRRAGLDPACLNHPDMKISAAAANQLLEDSAEMSGVENFGLRMAETRRLSVLGYLGLVARDAPTLRQLLGFLFQHMRFHNEALHLVINDQENFALIRQDVLLKGPACVRQSVELSLGGIVRIIKLYLGEEWQSRCTYFDHAKPRDSRLHKRMFGPTLEFSAEFSGILLHQSDLDRQLITADPVMASYSTRLWSGDEELNTQDVVREVRHLILILLPDGRCTIERVAGHLCIARQTVHGKLAREGLTFSQLVNETRLELSDRYLRQAGRSLAKIALLLGFSELSGYSRWHKVLLGEAPSARRIRLRSSPDAAV